MSNKTITAKLDKFFGFTAAGSSLRTEVVAGLTTCFPMAYILIANSGTLAKSGMEGAPCSWQPSFPPSSVH